MYRFFVTFTNPMQPSYSQTWLEEFDYHIFNLATDLRDGVRLARLVEVLTNGKVSSLQMYSHRS
jgi:hypothetical protein